MMRTWRKNFHGDTRFESFIPYPLSLLHLETSGFDKLVKETQDALDKLNRAALAMNQREVLMLIKKESEASWMLSAGKSIYPFGMTFFNNVWDKEEQAEIDNLTEATVYAIQDMGTLPISARLLKNAHYLVCKSPHYRKKYPGDFRKSPGWIGKEGCGLKKAVFIPPTGEDMTDSFSELEKYIHAETNMNILLRAALIHYQFEAIHPFIDANGRIGRLLNTLFLLENGSIQKPVLLLSDILGKHGIQYYAELQNLHESGRYENWIRFFLTSLKEAAENSNHFILKIHE